VTEASAFARLGASHLDLKVVRVDGLARHAESGGRDLLDGAAAPVAGSRR
jgi:hypothetical protein